MTYQLRDIQDVGEQLATKTQRAAEDAAYEVAKRAILYAERPPQPPSEVELLRREVRELTERLQLAAKVLAGEHECESGWDW